MNIIETAGLGKNYGRTWALRDCSFAMPEGHLAALVGPNGAGKTTLLHLLVGLTAAAAGSATVLGGLPAGSRAALDGIAFVAQDAPVYTYLTAENMIRLARNLNRSFDPPYARARLGELDIPLDRKAAKLSSGQRAQLALTLALARRPRLLILDEPLAALDPLARHDFMGTVLAAVGEDGVSVLMSSHVLAELQRVADFLILLTKGRVRVAETVEDLVSTHRVLTGPAGPAGPGAAGRGGAPGRHGGTRARLPANHGRDRAGSPVSQAHRVHRSSIMSALTLATGQNDSARTPRPLPWRRMVLVTWLQHRGVLIGVAALFGALAIYLGIMGLIIHHAWMVDMDCRPASSLTCQDLAQSFGSQWHGGDTIAFPLQLLPALIGAFAGAPILAREMETGTFRYAWTQGFGRTRWVIAKLALVGGPLAVIAGAFGILTYWYFGPFVAEGQLIPLDPRTFDLECLAFPGWVLAAFAIGAFAGILIRRVVPAMATAMAAAGGLGLAAGLYLRQYYLPPLVVASANGPAPSAWTLTTWYTGRGGQVIPGYIVNAACPGPGPLNSTPGSPPQCMPQHGYTQWWSYQPASRYWPFQGIEGAGLLLLAILLVAATIWLVHRRAA